MVYSLIFCLYFWQCWVQTQGLLILVLFHFLYLVFWYIYQRVHLFMLWNDYVHKSVTPLTYHFYFLLFVRGHLWRKGYEKQNHKAIKKVKYLITNFVVAKFFTYLWRNTPFKIFLLDKDWTQEYFHVRQVFYTELQPQLQSAFSDKIENRDQKNDIQLQGQILWKAVVLSSYHFFLTEQTVMVELKCYPVHCFARWQSLGQCLLQSNWSKY